MMRFLLDDELLSGTYDVATLLRPQRAVRCVDESDGAALVRMMTYLCQVWGGHAHPIIPIADLTVPAPYLRCLHHDQYDIIDRRFSAEPPLVLPKRIIQEPAWDHPAIIVAAHQRRDLWRTVEVAELDPEDPWAPIYAATLGVLPRELDANLRGFMGIESDLAFDEIVPIEYTPVTGSLDDLIARLTKTKVLSPRQLAANALATGLEPDSSFLGESPLLPSPHHERRAAGPNVIVVISDGNAADLALLWTLRGAHGDRRAMPIGVPADQVTPGALARLQQPGIAAAFGLGGGSCRLTSTSVELDELVLLASGTPMAAVPYDKLLTFGPAPGRHRSQVAIFSEGAAYLEAMTESDREPLILSRQMMRPPSLVLDVRVPEAPLPADLTMRGARYAPSFQAGSAQVRPNANSIASVRVQWPSSWTALAAVARTRNLHVSQSEPGRAASTLIAALGSVDSVRWLMQRPLIALLHRLAERSGMAWQKNQLNDLRAKLTSQGRDAVVIDEAEVALSTPEHVVTPTGEGRALDFQQFRRVLSSEKAAARWVMWAERHHLLVRGVDIVCPNCGASSWLPVASMPPPVGCSGCGRLLPEPYGPRHVKFTYRMGEPLRRVLETDSLGHVFVLHWFTKLLDLRGGLVGAHPGVNFDSGEGENRRRIGEADVLLLFVDGRLVPIEVKRTAAGVDESALEKMDRLAVALQAPFDVVAMSQPARDYPALPDAVRQPVDHLRLVISDDQVLDRLPLWSAGSNPFRWDPRGEADDGERDQVFIRDLEAIEPDEPWDLIRDTLLNEP
jgi:hypothetical protein